MSKLWFLLIIPVVVIPIAIRMATMETDLKLTKTYKMPELTDLRNLATLGARQWAVAIDGVVASCGTAGVTNNLETCASLPAQPTASTAKMILALAIMEAKPLELGKKGENIIITEEYYKIYAWYVTNGGSNTAVAVNEAISEYDALASVLLASSNNMADTLAIWAFGSLDNYREYATKMLQNYGIYNTTIGADACGFNENTISTAADLARIGAKVLENPVLAEIVGTADYIVPVAGKLTNSNKNLGRNGVIGVKTGWIGSPSGYCLVSGYLVDGHIVTVATLGAETRLASFEESNAVVEAMQARLLPLNLVATGDEVGYFESWWTGRVPIVATEDLVDYAWAGEEISSGLSKTELKILLGKDEKKVKVAAEVAESPTFWQRFLHVFGWSA